MAPRFTFMEFAEDLIQSNINFVSSYTMEQLKIKGLVYRPSINSLLDLGSNSQPSIL